MLAYIYLQQSKYQSLSVTDGPSSTHCQKAVVHIAFSIISTNSQFKPDNIYMQTV